MTILEKFSRVTTTYMRSGSYTVHLNPTPHARGGSIALEGLNKFSSQRIGLKSCAIPKINIGPDAIAMDG